MRVLDVKGNTEAENESPGKWTGHITASIAAPLDRTWQIGSDFSGLHQFVPIVDVCERLKGCNRIPGCLRFYTMNSATGLPGGKRKAWAKDRLLNMDEETHSYTYAVEGSNMHLENCQISFKASDGKDGTTIVKWAWEVDPTKRSTKEKSLSDMSEFGCTFIKGLEAAAATADSTDLNFQGAPPDPLNADRDSGDHSDDPPVLSLMKSRLETLTQSLNKISQKLEDCSISPDLYHNELESLQSILSEGRRSLVSHLHGYMSETRVCESKSVGTGSLTDETYEDYMLSTTEEISPQANASTSKVDSEVCRRKFLDAITRLHLPGIGNTVRALDGGQCQASRSAMFPPLASKEEQLRVEMDEASRGAYEAFQDFSNQFHRDLRDDIAHQLEFVGARLESISAGLKDGDFDVGTKIESHGENCGVCSEPVIGSSPDARMSQSPPSDGAKMSCLGCQTPDHNPDEFGDWDPDEFQNRRLQGSPKGIHTLRSRSGLLFRDLLQKDMFQHSNQAAYHEAELTPVTSEFRNSFRYLKATVGGQRSPPSNNPKVTNVPKDYHHSQPQGSESGRFGTSAPLEDGNTHIPGSFEADDHKHVNELDTGGHNQGVKMDHWTSELRRRTLEPEGHKASSTGLMPIDSSSRKFQSSEELEEGFHQLQDSPQGWKHRGSKMCRTAQNLEADLSRLQITESKLQDGSLDEPGDEGFHEYTALPRPGRLPLDIWPDFQHGELVKEGQGEDNARREYTEHNLESAEFRSEEFSLIPTNQKTRAIEQAPTSPSPSSSSSQSSKNYKKFLQLKSLPPRFSSSGVRVPQTGASGLRSHMTLPISSLDEISSNNSPLPGSPSAPLDQALDCPLSALHSSRQCANHVMLDLRNQIAPGVFHSRQGKQTRVIIDIPEDLEAKQANRRHLRSLVRKAEIYKEFALLGIQKPPTEEQLLADFASARCKKQQAISEPEMPMNVYPVYQPYYADGRVFPPDAGPSPTAVERSRFEHADAYTVDLPPSKSLSGQKPGHSSETRILSNKGVASQRGSPSGRIMERSSLPDQQSNASNSFQKDEGHMTSEGLRGEPAAQELAAIEYSKRTKPPRGPFQGHPGSQPRIQPSGGSTCQHGFPLQQKREFPIKGHGRRRDTPHVLQPATSICLGNSNTRVSSLTETLPVQPSRSQGMSRTKSRVSSSSYITKTGYGDKAYPGHPSMGSGDSLKEALDEMSLGFATSPENHHKIHPEIRPEIRIYSQAKNFLKINSPAIHADDSQQSEGSPLANGKGSLAKILINFPRDSGDSQTLELTHYRPPTSRQGSLDEVVNNVPSDSGSSEFNPYRPSGNLGSVNCSTGSESSNGLPFSRQLHIADIHQHTTPATEKPPNLANSLTLLHFDEPEELPDAIGSLMYPDDVLVEGRRILKAMGPLGRCHDCPFKQLKEKVDEVIQTSESGSPHSLSPALSVRVLWADQHSRQSPFSSRGEESSGPPHQTRSHILDEVSRQLDPKVEKAYSDAGTQTGIVPEGVKLRTSQDTQTSMELEGEGLKARQYSQILDSMASSAAQFTDHPIAQTQKVHDMVQQTGDVGLMTRWNVKKKRKADELAFRTRSTITLLNSAINVKEFADESKSYSTWLDGVATQKSEGSEGRSQNSETQTSRDVSEKSESRSELHREPRFREDSAANFLGSVAGQILHEFSDSQKSAADAQDPVKGPQEPRFREDSAANFLGTMTQKIVQEFTDNTPNPSQSFDQSEGPGGRRFRERSALIFLEALSEQLLPEFKTRVSPQTIETAEVGGAPRFRESSAINFLDTLRGLVMQTSNQNTVSISEVPSLSDQNVRAPENLTYPTIQDGTSESYLEGQAYQTEGLNYPLARGGQRYLDDGLSYQLESGSHGSPSEGLSYQPGVESHGSPSEGLSYQPKSESHGSPREGLSYQPELESHGSPGEGLSHQPELESNGSLGEGFNYPTESEGQGSQDWALRYPPESDGQGFPDRGFNYQPESAGRGSSDGGLTYHPESGQGSPDGGLSYQLESEGQGFPDGGLSYQPASGEGSPDGALSYQPESEGQGFPDGGLRYQPESGQGSPDGALSYPPESEGQGFPDGGLSYQPESGEGLPDGALSYQPESEGQGFPDGDLSYQLESGQGSPDGALSYPPESEGQGSPYGGLSQQPESEGQVSLDRTLSDQPESEGEVSPDGGLSYQPESEGQGSPDGALSYQPESEGQGSPDGGLSYQPESEGQGYPDEGVSYQPDADGQAYPDEGVSSHPDGSTSTAADQEPQNQLMYGKSQNSQAQLGAIGPGPGGSRRSSQVAVLNEMLQDLHATVSRSRQNSVSNPGGS